MAWHRSSFFWVTAAFTNATLRLFPLVMDIIQAIAKATPFSDEGDVVLAMTTNPAARAVLLLGILAVFSAGRGGCAPLQLRETPRREIGRYLSP